MAKEAAPLETALRAAVADSVMCIILQGGKVVVASQQEIKRSALWEWL